MLFTIKHLPTTQILCKSYTNTITHTNTKTQRVLLFYTNITQTQLQRHRHKRPGLARLYTIYGSLMGNRNKTISTNKVQMRKWNWNSVNQRVKILFSYILLMKKKYKYIWLIWLWKIPTPTLAIPTKSFWMLLVAVIKKMNVHNTFSYNMLNSFVRKTNFLDVFVTFMVNIV